MASSIIQRVAPRPERTPMLSLPGARGATLALDEALREALLRGPRSLGNTPPSC